MKGAQFGEESLLSWDRYIRGFSERQKIIVTLEGPLVLESSTDIIGLHEGTLFMLFSCLSLPRRFFNLCLWLSKNQIATTIHNDTMVTTVSLNFRRLLESQTPEKDV